VTRIPPSSSFWHLFVGQRLRRIFLFDHLFDKPLEREQDMRLPSDEEEDSAKPLTDEQIAKNSMTAEFASPAVLSRSTGRHAHSQHPPRREKS